MDQNALISVIVPVYNVERYLPECVESLRAQTYANLEILLVDDGSPDRCGAICDEYAAKDSRIKVIHKPNGGVSSARNAGLDAATGEYIGFVDSDDFAEKHMYEILLETAIRQGSDMTVCNAFVVDEDGGNPKAFPINEADAQGAITGEQMLEELVRRPNTRHVVLWNKLYTRQLLSRCRFPDGKINEDSYVMHHLYDVCEKIVIIPDALYYYRTREGSIMHSEKTTQYFDIVEVLMDRIRLLVRRERHDLAEPILMQAIGMLTALHLEVKNRDREFRTRASNLRKALIRSAGTVRVRLSKGNRLRVLMLRVFPLYVAMKKIHMGLHGRGKPW